MLKSLTFKPRRMISQGFLLLACILGLASRESRIWMFKVSQEHEIRKIMHLAFSSIVCMKPEEIAEALDSRTTVQFLISRWHPFIGLLLFSLQANRITQFIDTTDGRDIVFTNRSEIPLEKLNEHCSREIHPEIAIDGFNTLEYIRGMSTTAVVTLVVQTNKIAYEREFILAGFSFNSKRSALAFKLAAS